MGVNSRGVETEVNPRNDKREKNKANLTYQGAMNLRTAEILCRMASEMGEATVDGLLDGMQQASFDLYDFSGTMQ